MLSTRLRTMAVALQKIVSPSVAGLATPRLSHLDSSRLATSASPLLRPWWRSLSQSLTTSVRSAAPLRPALPYSRSLSVVAKAADEDAVVPEEEGEAGEVGAPLKTKAMPKRVKNIMNILNEEAVAAARKDKIIPDIRPGDVLAMRVEVPENKRRISLIRGIVISKRNAGINTTFRIRRVMAGVGVEMVFPLYSPNIKEIKVVDRRKARRAKLYYLRDKIAKMSTVN